MSTADVLLLIVDAHDGTQLRNELDPRGYVCLVVDTAADALLTAQLRTPEIVLMDHDLPDLSGLLIIPKLRNLPLVLCSGSQSSAEIVLGLKSGADDFVRKPHDPDELAQRLRTVLHRATAANPAPGVTRCGAITINGPRRQVEVFHKDAHLTATEYRLAVALVAGADTMLSKREIAQAIWGARAVGGVYDHAIDVNVTRVRRKLIDAGLPFDTIKNMRGYGYILSSKLVVETN